MDVPLRPRGRYGVEVSTRDDVQSAAIALLGSLSDEQRADLCRPLSDETLRRDWTYVPRDRAGLTLGAFGRTERKAIHRLLASSLSPHAYAQAATIMALEDVLDRSDGGGRDRHSTDYWTIFFGDPADDAWSWRFEGHHVSVNVTVVDGSVSISPCFLGANPAVVRYRGAPVVAPITQEEQLARTLLAAMDSAQRSTAIVSDNAPEDIVTRAAPRIDARPLEPIGVSGAVLARSARDVLQNLADIYVDRLPSDVAKQRRVRAEEISFAWLGETEPGLGRYYRMQGPDFLVEYDNTQSGANHIHSVCRFPTADFGDDILAAHYAAGHAEP